MIEIRELLREEFVTAITRLTVVMGPEFMYTPKSLHFNCSSLSEMTTACAVLGSEAGTEVPLFQPMMCNIILGEPLEYLGVEVSNITLWPDILPGAMVHTGALVIQPECCVGLRAVKESFLAHQDQPFMVHDQAEGPLQSFSISDSLYRIEVPLQAEVISLRAVG